MMSSEEEKRILKMVEEGVITPEEAMKLIRALEDEPAGEPVAVVGADEGTAEDSAMEFETVKSRARRFAQLPLWIGIGFTLLAAFWLFGLVENTNYGFWFVCAWFPLLLGILLVTLSSGGLDARWLYVDVHQGKGEWPEHITFGLPVPLGLLAWIIRNFRHQMRDVRDLDVEAMLETLSTATREEPLVVNVQDDEEGDRVQIYIG
jgi:hypothetical protein